MGDSVGVILSVLDMATVATIQRVCAEVCANFLFYNFCHAIKTCETLQPPKYNQNSLYLLDSWGNAENGNSGYGDDTQWSGSDALPGMLTFKI